MAKQTSAQLNAQRRYRERNREALNQKAQERRDRLGYEPAWQTSLKAKYGLTMDDYWAMHADQKGVCRICGQPETVQQNGRTRKAQRGPLPQLTRCPGSSLSEVKRPHWKGQ